MHTVIPGGLAGERLVDQADVGVVLGVAVAADAVDISALGGVVEIGEAGVVQLQIGAALRGKAGDLVAVDQGQVVPERLHLGVRGPVDHGAAAAVMQHRGRGYG